MIKWFKRLFGIVEVAPYENDESVMIKKYEELLRSHKALLESDVLRYLPLKVFDVRDREFVRKIAAIHSSEEMKFLVYDLRQQCVEKMVEGNTEVNLQTVGILKGIDIVMKNLAGYDNIWQEIVSQENRDGKI